MINKPYLLFLGDAPDKFAAKVAYGIKDWRPEQVVGQISYTGCKADIDLEELTPEQAMNSGAKTMVIGIANRGGYISDNWKGTLIQAMEAGMDLAAGLHNFLNNEEDLCIAAKKYGRMMHDVRQPGHKYPIATGKKRSGKRCLAVGTDVSIGKMYTALAMQREMHLRGIKATFRATGQTGILIEGVGVPLDAVIADFMSGAIEWLSPENDDDHWDLIEGQGSLYHASYSGVTLALIHGGQPDALVLCHDPSRKFMRGLPDYNPPSLKALRDTALNMARIVNPRCQIIGISVNTSSLAESEALDYIKSTEEEYSLPTTDPFRFGTKKLVDNLLRC